MQSLNRTTKLSASTLIFNILSYSLVVFITIACLVPIWLIISASFSLDELIRFNGYSFLPQGFTLESYDFIFRYPMKIVRAYGVSIYITAIGTFFGLFLITMTAYVISRKSFKYRNYISFFFYFTTLFNGGMVSTYVFYIRYLGLKDNLLSLIFPLLFNVFYLLIMRSFISAVPSATIESAKIDGAGEWLIYSRIVMPLVKPALLTAMIFSVQALWNNPQALLIYTEQLKTLPLAITQIIGSPHAPNVARAGVNAAGILIMMFVPITLFIFAQSNILKTMASSGIKE